MWRWTIWLSEQPLWNDKGICHPLSLFNKCRLLELSFFLFCCIILRDVFQCSVLISIWRVRHAWHKNLVKRCSEIEMRAEIFRRLGMVVDDICKGNGNVVLFEDCMQDFMDGSDFMDYFKAVWYPRIGELHFSSIPVKPSSKIVLLSSLL